jgi:hypothetical protein
MALNGHLLPAATDRFEEAYPVCEPWSGLMTVVAIYGFHGVFEGQQDYDYRHPEIAAAHKCMLLLAQPDDGRAEDTARVDCAKYGFPAPDFTGFGPLKVEVLSTKQYRSFAGFYEEALSDGSALLYYP